MPYQTLNNIQLYYETHGSAENPTVLLVHGLGSSARDWELQVPYFAQDYQVITVDMRGHGLSDKPRAAYSMTQFALDTVLLLDALEIDKVHYVGLSMGGMIGFQMALDFPERLHSMTITNATASLVPKTLQEKIQVWMRFIIVRLLGMKKMGEVLAKRLFVYPQQENLRQIFIKRWAENDRQAYLNTLRALVGWSVEKQVGKITVPSLILASDGDYTPLDLKETLVARMPKAELVVIEDARHALPMEKPHAFNEAVGAFLKKVR